MNSPSPAQEDNLRRLLDQRAGRADIHHARFPSLTEFSDSPSIYSHAHFSPRSPHLDSSPPQFGFAIPPQYARPSFEAVRSFSPSAIGVRELDIDGVTQTTTTRGRSTSPESIPPDDEESDPHLSFLGPTMRFHSPAPWETEGIITEGGEQEDDARSFVTKRSRSKTRGDGFIKSFGRTASAKATSAARPSLESTNGREKNSIESQVAHAALRALPQAAASTTSSSRPSRPGLVFARGRARTVSSLASPDTSLPPPLHVSPGSGPVFIHTSATSPAPTRSASPSPSMYSSTLNPTDASRPTSPQSSCGLSDFVHPYANPDLAYDAGPTHAATSFLPPSSLGRRTVFPSDSAATMSESMATQSSSTLTPDTSMSSVTDYHADVLLKKVVGSVQGKVISSPLSANTSHQGQKPGSQPGQDKGQLALPGQVPGWSDLSVSPTFNLISLQEAQAQAQARGRSRTHTQAAPDAPPSRTDPAATSPSNVARLRTRTASAGSKKAQPLIISNPLPLPRLSTEDTPAALPRSLKQKKSGFMRLFNGKEKDKPSTPSPQPLAPAPAPSQPRTPKISSARVPVPSLSPSLVPQSPLQFDGIIRGDGGENDSTEDLSYEGSINQHGPPLSIVTQGAASGVSSGGSPSRSSPSARPGIRSAPPSASEVASDLGLAPASAPPLTTTFSGLSLRPISTVFSAHFADHIVSTDSASSAAQPDTPSSPSHPPPSPASAKGSAHDGYHVVEDDPYVVIQRLQEQMKSTRKAWQHQIWELEGQVRDLRAEIDATRLQEMRGERCLLCGRSDEPGQGAGGTLKPRELRPGVVDRPRARTGVGTRFGAAT